MANKYDITVRSLLENKTEHCHDLIARRYVMDIHELNRWIKIMMTDCNIDINNHPDLFPDVTEFDIARMFGAITETLSVLEQEHNSNPITLKILNAYVTVQVIFSEEETTWQSLDYGSFVLRLVRWLRLFFLVLFHNYKIIAELKSKFEFWISNQNLCFVFEKSKLRFVLQKWIA